MSSALNMPPHSWTVNGPGHPGSSAGEIAREPHWDAANKHRIGLKDREGQVPGIINQQDACNRDLGDAGEMIQRVKMRARDENPIDSEHIKENTTLGSSAAAWSPRRYVLEPPRDYTGTSGGWPVNEGKKQQEQEMERDDCQEVHEWRRARGENKHSPAYAVLDDSGYDSGVEQIGPTSYQEPDELRLHQKYTPQEIALLRGLRHEKEYVSQLKSNNGKGESPQTQRMVPVSVDDQDRSNPDNWIPRSPDLIRVAGKHPLNAEPHLRPLFDAGLVTPNELHYVRNHGAVPRLLWERHRLEIQGGKLTLSMDQLKTKYTPINIPVLLACAGNRRKELNMVKRSKGFDWGVGAVGCAYWKGPLLRDVLLSADIPVNMPGSDGKRYWVHFEGTDEQREGKYATSIPFQHAMDPTNDVILAYEMNDMPLPPDHGYPVRLIVPGYVSGRSIKWLHKIWISDKENDSHYHIWHNRVLPSFVTEKDGEFANTLFHHPDTACYEQNLNSVIAKPAHGESIPFVMARKGQSYRIAGYAYGGGGHEVQRVEVSLDDGETWLYCIRQFPDYPIRHGNKFWTWLHWHIDVDLAYLLRAKSIVVRCFDVFKQTQPEKPIWNVLGLMNNSWYTVRPSIEDGVNLDVPSILFKHPVEAGTGKGGWMQPSAENQLEIAKLAASEPPKQFTRQEIERHNKENDCWIVVDGKVYDVTNVLDWHPGGKASVLNHAGKVHKETSDEFASTHDAYGYQKLQECILGVITEKAAHFINNTAPASSNDCTFPHDDDDDHHHALSPHHWQPIRLIARHRTSPHADTYTFALPPGQPILGLPTCQHLQIGIHTRTHIHTQTHTPIRPLLPAPKHHHHHHQYPPATTPSPLRRDSKQHTDPHRDGTTGTFDIAVPPSSPHAALLAALPLNATLSLRGPFGGVAYHGCGAFTIDGVPRSFSRISLVLGCGIEGEAAGHALLGRVLGAADPCGVRVVVVGGEEAMLRKEMDGFVGEGRGQVRVAYAREVGDGSVLRGGLFAPERDGEGVVLVCGGERMVVAEVVPVLKDWGYEEGANLFGL